MVKKEILGAHYASSLKGWPLQDGRVIGVPLAWFPLLRDAAPEQRQKYEIGGRGVALYWEEIDEDISIAGLMAGVDSSSL